ncbi:unnamed protein product [Choristocarpus tenellus]
MASRVKGGVMETAGKAHGHDAVMQDVNQQDGQKGRDIRSTRNPVRFQPTGPGDDDAQASQGSTSQRHCQNRESMESLYGDSQGRSETVGMTNGEKVKKSCKGNEEAVERAVVVDGTHAGGAAGLDDHPEYEEGVGGVRQDAGEGGETCAGDKEPGKQATDGLTRKQESRLRAFLDGVDETQANLAFVALKKEPFLMQEFEHLASKIQEMHKAIDGPVPRYLPHSELRAWLLDLSSRSVPLLRRVRARYGHLHRRWRTQTLGVLTGKGQTGGDADLAMTCSLCGYDWRNLQPRSFKPRTRLEGQMRRGHLGGRQGFGEKNKYILLGHGSDISPEETGSEGRSKTLHDLSHPSQGNGVYVPQEIAMKHSASGPVGTTNSTSLLDLDHNLLG